MSPDERSTDQKIDDLSLTLDRVLGIVQDHSVALNELKGDMKALRVDVQRLASGLDRLTDHVMAHQSWHIGQQPGGPGPES